MAFSMHVNMNRCTGCGNCVVSCPVNALELYTLDPVTKEKIYRVVNGKSISLDVNMELCAGCGVCVKPARTRSSPCPAGERWKLSHPSEEMPVMTKLNLNMITQRSVEEGAAMEKGKTNPDYFEACSIIEMNPEDMKKAGIWVNSNVKVTSECGTVVVKCIHATQYLPAGPCPHPPG